MNIREDIKQLKTGRRELRNFGLLVGGVFAALGIFFWATGKALYPWFLIPGAILILFGVIVPRGLKWVYIAWMALAFALGFVVSHVILTVFFFLVVTPIGLAARLFGKDFLRLKLDRKAPTYWIRREHRRKTASDYERQF
jgi:hypothetical protein